MHLVAKYRQDIPQNIAEAFMLLFKAGITKEKTATDVVAMTGFRNVGIHEYQQWNPVGAGSKPALVPNSPKVALSHILSSLKRH